MVLVDIPVTVTIGTCAVWSPIVLVDDWTVDCGCVTIINSSLSQSLEQYLLRNDYHGPRLAEYEVPKDNSR